MTIHSVAAYCKKCWRIQCRCKPERKKHDDEQPKQPENDPTDEGILEIEKRQAEVRERKKAAGEEQRTEEFGKLAFETSSRYVRGRTGTRIF